MPSPCLGETARYRDDIKRSLKKHQLQSLTQLSLRRWKKYGTNDYGSIFTVHFQWLVLEGVWGEGSRALPNREKDVIHKSVSLVCAAAGC